MTATPEAGTVLPTSQVEELLQTLVKALRAYQMYLPNNPIHQRATANLCAAFAPVWAATEELTLAVAETEFLWEDQVVYSQPTKGESLAWTLYKDGMRSLTLRRGAEAEELPQFLETVNRARFLPADANDDLLTLLWEQEFALIQYRFAELLDGGEPLPEGTGVAGGGAPATPEAAAERRAQVAEEAPPPATAVVDLEEFDSTPYFLSEEEVAYLVREVEQEYQRDVRESVLNALFDLFELQPAPETRAEILAVLEQLFPHLLNARDFRAAAMVLRESKAVAACAPDVLPAQAQRLGEFAARLSEPEITGQLIQSLDEASAAVREEVALVLRELRPPALDAILAWLPRVSTPQLRTLLEAAADRLATDYPGEVTRLLRERDSEALPALLALCGRLGLVQVVPAVGEVLDHPDAGRRLAAAQALAQLGTPGALGLLERAVGDSDRGVRLVAVRALGARGYKGALRRIEAAALGRGAEAMDLTEKMAVFEAYGAIAGPAALERLTRILLPGGLLSLGRRPTAELRACAAIALGRIGTPESRAVLERAASDKEAVVRNAVGRALRGVAG